MLTAAAVCMILADAWLLILADIVIGGLQSRVVGVRLGRAPQGMTAGGIFPAIFGTVALTLVDDHRRRCRPALLPRSI